jgi:hypothetical protein
MYRWFYEGSSTLHFALLSMVLFLGAFVAILIRTFTTRHDEIARMPLDDDEKGGRHG